MIQHELSNASMLKLVSFLWWGSLYLVCAVKAPEQSPEWCSRAITLLHGSVTAVVGYLQCSAANPFHESSYHARVTPATYALMIWSWGYFAFDLLWCLLAWTESTLMLTHHLSALVAITIYMKKEFTGCTFPASIFLMEVTNPLLQTRWFLKNRGSDRTLIYTLVEGAYILLFLTLRGLLGTIMVYQILRSEAFEFDEKIIGVIFYVVSLFFIWEIIGYCHHKYRHKIDIASWNQWLATHK